MRTSRPSPATSSSTSATRANAAMASSICAGCCSTEGGNQWSRWPRRLGLPRQNLGHFIAQSTWQYTEVMRRVAERAVAVIDPVAWLIDDHPFVRYGHGTAGAIVQHCGEREQHLCQVAVSVHAMSDLGSTPLHWRLFIRQLWADDPERRAKTGIPSALTHRTKQQIVLELLDEAAEWGLRPPVVIADSDYGTNVAFRNALTSARSAGWWRSTGTRRSCRSPKHRSAPGPSGDLPSESTNWPEPTNAAPVGSSTVPRRRIIAPVPAGSSPSLYTSPGSSNEDISREPSIDFCPSVCC
ncbi:transposase [Nonomuraea diastatica]|uniref:Transposase n=1 Tax=Nonomuraea diastatica TaxID=1848329 RepID=A0A4V2YDV2_9ACTN|nr:transposase [Nonomuraea diastatica]